MPWAALARPGRPGRGQGRGLEGPFCQPAAAAQIRWPPFPLLPPSTPPKVNGIKVHLLDVLWVVGVDAFPLKRNGQTLQNT